MSIRVLSHIFLDISNYIRCNGLHCSVSHKNDIDSCPVAIHKTFIIFDTSKRFTLPWRCVLVSVSVCVCTFLTCCFIGIQFYFIIIYSRSLIESFVSLINQWPSPIALCIVTVAIVPMSGNYMTMTPNPLNVRTRLCTRKTIDSATHTHSNTSANIHKYLLIFGIDPKTHSTKSSCVESSPFPSWNFQLSQSTTRRSAH